MRKKITSSLLSYENQWVALSPHRKRVVASGATIKEVDRKLKRLKNNDAILTMVLPFDKIYSP